MRDLSRRVNVIKFETFCGTANTTGFVLKPRCTPLCNVESLIFALNFFTCVGHILLKESPLRGPVGSGSERLGRVALLNHR